jgi:hypothetical protein
MLKIISSDFFMRKEIIEKEEIFFPQENRVEDIDNEVGR